MNDNERITKDNVKSDTSQGIESQILTSDSVKSSDNESQDKRTITGDIVNNPSSDCEITETNVNKRGNIANLKPVRTKEEARQRGRAGGLKSGEVRRNKKTMRETLQNALNLELDAKKLEELGADMELMNGERSVLSAIVASTIREAINGDPRAIQFVRDSIGEAPKQEISQEIITRDDIELLRRNIVS